MLEQINRRISHFIHSPTGGGIVLAVAAVLAMVVSNSPLSEWYVKFLNFSGELRIGGDWLVLSKSMLHWVNDLWMAVFFFIIGLEIKREVLDGQLASRSQALLPAGAALGGMLVPALIYAAINFGQGDAMRGWAIPAATDIAFALGIVMLLGSRVPVSLKIFLTAVAVIDDLGAILIIAFFYTEQLSVSALLGAAAGLLLLFGLNRARVMAIGPYVMIGLVIWLFVYKSGIHATLAGVATALMIPLSDGRGGSPLKTAEKVLHPWVAFTILPMFAFANAGVSLAGVTPATLLQSIPLGIAAGLLLGKAIGVFGASWLLMRFGGASLPAGASQAQFFGVCLLCGVGFTMSLFIGGLAFNGLGPDYETQVKLGVLCGSILSGVAGTLILLRSNKTSA
jgi:NhaA family Na+:H+ antiporter